VVVGSGIGDSVGEAAVLGGREGFAFTKCGEWGEGPTAMQQCLCRVTDGQGTQCTGGVAHVVLHMLGLVVGAGTLTSTQNILSRPGAQQQLFWKRLNVVLITLG
jgi:hypothetical protein